MSNYGSAATFENHKAWRFPLHTLLALFFSALLLYAADPLPSWNDTAPKKSIIAFLEKVTTFSGSLDGPTEFADDKVHAPHV